jgi:hypothetical protein
VVQIHPSRLSAANSTGQSAVLLSRKFRVRVPGGVRERGEISHVNAGSSNGRTAVPGAANRSSSLCPAAKPL